ncbi:MAG: hypothetical protein ACRDFS_11910 [Chloroflexota bacterium]
MVRTDVQPEIGAERIASFQEEVLGWYAENKRDLPWRGAADPYHILVSEIMLQQTQVSRVVPKYREFLLRFPTLSGLARARADELLRAWQGLGYNRRAVRLREAAKVVATRHAGALPETVAELEALPGVGSYTARAVACFAFGLHTSVIDTNVRRVLAGFAGRTLSERETEALARRMLPAGKAADWNQALMDYGAAARQGAAPRGSGRHEPFADSNRFWRGRIVDTLRHHESLELGGLLGSLPPQVDEMRVRGLLRILHEEGLVTYDATDDRVTLGVAED